MKWTKKLGKGRQKWESKCKKIGLKPHKFKMLVKTWFASKVVFFQETLEYVIAINLYYNRLTSKLQTQVPFNSTWAIVKVVT
jgi:hypothetical protein